MWAGPLHSAVLFDDWSVLLRMTGYSWPSCNSTCSQNLEYTTNLLRQQTCAESQLTSSQRFLMSNHSFFCSRGQCFLMTQSISWTCIQRRFVSACWVCYTISHFLFCLQVCKKKNPDHVGQDRDLNVKTSSSHTGLEEDLQNSCCINYQRSGPTSKHSSSAVDDGCDNNKCHSTVTDPFLYLLNKRHWFICWHCLTIYKNEMGNILLFGSFCTSDFRQLPSFTHLVCLSETNHYLV